MQSEAGPQQITIEQRSSSVRRHFEILDGLRGIAAYCVLLFHSFGGVWFPHGYIDVDLFFMLSGFVIAYSYRYRLVTGMSVREFAIRRFVRLYPMIFAAVIIDLAICLVHNHTNPQHAYNDRDIFISTATALFLIPNLVSNSISVYTFPITAVLWSMFFEAVANIVYALFARSMSKSVLACLALTGLVVTVAIGRLGGESAWAFWQGFPRVACGFFGGALLYELWAEDKLPRVSLGLLPLSVIVIVISDLPTKVEGLAFPFIMAAFSTIIILGANARPSNRSIKICNFLGAVSYPVYLLHKPTLYIVVGVVKALVSPLAGASYMAAVALVLIATTILAYVTIELYETPLRGLLGRLLLKRPPSRLLPERRLYDLHSADLASGPAASPLAAGAQYAVGRTQIG